MSRALLQAVPDSYVHATHGFLSDGHAPIDLALARRQHAAVCEGMAWLGYTCSVLPAVGAGPDAVFVEDPVVVHGGRGALLRSAHPGRRDEGRRLTPVLADWVGGWATMPPDHHADGGDVLIGHDRAWIGVSSRTNDAGARWIGAALDLPVQAVPLPDRTLHLKCRATLLPDGRLLATQDYADALGVEAIVVPVHEAYAANVVGRRNRVLCAAGHPATAGLLEAAGFEVRTVELSEIRKGDGSLTCLSVREG